MEQAGKRERESGYEVMSAATDCALTTGGPLLPSSQHCIGKIGQDVYRVMMSTRRDLMPLLIPAT